MNALQRARHLRDTGHPEEAARCATAILSEDGGHIGALRLLASIRIQDAAPDEAVLYLERAVEQDASCTDTLLELGIAQLAADRPLDARVTLEEVRARRPRDAAACRALANVHLSLSNKSEATALFRQALAILPYDIYVAHMLAALTGEATKATTSYVTDLFDTHAEEFDRHLTQTLHYRIPKAIADMLAGRHSGTVLDLGCGTGLVAAALGSSVEHIDGVDLAPQMIRLARARNLYRHLRPADLLETLRKDADFTGPYDLVTAADVFVYFGALEDVFVAICGCLRPGGLFAFSVEASYTEDVMLRASGRFAHTAGYIQYLASVSGFSILQANSVPIRFERSRPIDGMLYLLRRDGGHPA